VLEAEDENITTTIRQIEQSIEQEHKQVEGIEREKNKVLKDIKKLHTRQA